MSTAALSIGDFSRATHLTVKTLRYYHEAYLLEPAEIDPHSGYRRYDIDQIPTAQVIRRLRDLRMPVEGVRAVLQAPDLGTRDNLIAAHLRRLEDELGQTQAAISSLRDLLEHPVTDLPVERRLIAAIRVSAISAAVAASDIGHWVQGALGELYATALAQGIDTDASEPAGGIYGNGLFEADGDHATVYLPLLLRPVGRVEQIDLPTTDLAVVIHAGPEPGIDRAYGVLAAYVARHALAVDGPIRERYPVNRHHTAEPARWRTEIGWPIFPIGVTSGHSRP